MSNYGSHTLLAISSTPFIYACRLDTERAIVLKTYDETQVIAVLCVLLCRGEFAKLN